MPNCSIRPSSNGLHLHRFPWAAPSFWRRPGYLWSAWCGWHCAYICRWSDRNPSWDAWWTGPAFPCCDHSCRSMDSLKASQSSAQSQYISIYHIWQWLPGNIKPSLRMFKIVDLHSLWLTMTWWHARCKILHCMWRVRWYKNLILWILCTSLLAMKQSP